VKELELLDWKRRTFELYRRVRHQAVTDPHAAWVLWRSTRDDMFRSHPQSPLPERARRDHREVPYFDYDPAYRVVPKVEEINDEHFDIPVSNETTIAFTRVGKARFSLNGDDATLDIYWLKGYGGGVFIPFRDATSGEITYGGGRYLLDTVKGADLGAAGGALIFDFNFAYNPSCSYDERWVCPLAPPSNHLSIEVRAGEKL
jgi:uncharacterized protein (DUF1684 family)